MKLKGSGTIGKSSVYLLKALIAFSRDRGADTETILQAINFDAQLLKNKQTRVPLQVLNRLWNEIADALHDPFLGLHFGEAFSKQGEGHFLFAIMKNCETLQKALQSLIRFHGLMTDIVKPSLAVINGKAHLELVNPLGEAAITGHLSDAVLSLLATVLRTITNDEIVFENIYITHSAVENCDEYTRVLGVKPIFRAEMNSIVFSESELNRAFPLAHHEFGAQLHNFAEKLENELYRSKKYSDRVLILLKNNILKGRDCSLKTVAGIFNMSIRRLQTKLKEEGFTYQALLDETRKGIALHYMKNEEVLFCDIAFLLGFSEQSSFNHAFKKWTGLTPGEYRETIIGRSGNNLSRKAAEI